MKNLFPWIVSVFFLAILAILAGPEMTETVVSRAVFGLTVGGMAVLAVVSLAVWPFEARWRREAQMRAEAFRKAFVNIPT